MFQHPSAGTITAAPGTGVADRYVDLADTRLAVALSAEDVAEDGGLDPFERTTCYAHRRWRYQCVSSPLHVVRGSGRRWCRRCECAVTVAVDELVGDLTLTCPRCGEMPAGAANRQVVRSCRASLAAAAAAREDRI